MATTRSRALALAALTVLAAVAVACSGAPTPTTLDVAVTDLDGGAHRPLAPRTDGAATLLLFVTTDCPIANAYAPEIVDLRRAFEGPRLRVLVVHVDPDVDAAAARAHAAAYGHTAPVLLDTSHALAGPLGITVTPEAALLDPAGHLLYRGRIDDQWADLGRRKPRPSRTELRDALRAWLAGEPVPVARAPAVGCDLPLLPADG